MANEKRLFDTETVIRKLRNANCAECNVVRKIQCSACWVDDVVSLLEDAPTVDAVEVVHGRWERESVRIKDMDIVRYRNTCSICGKKVDFLWRDSRYNYCPNCGAKMDGGNEDGVQ